MRKAHLSSRLKWDGLVFDTKHFGEVVVEDYISCDQVVVRFKDTGNITTVTSSQLKGGRVKDTSVPTVCGVGVTNGVRTQVDGKILREYSYWQSMLIRCYDKNFKIKNPTYLYCEASENFKDYSYFFDWCKTQKGFNVLGWQLDKDILGDGTIYSEDVCVFVPQELNSFFKKKEGLTMIDCIHSVFESEIRTNKLMSIIDQHKDNLDQRVLKMFDYNDRMKLFN